MNNETTASQFFAPKPMRAEHKDGRTVIMKSKTALATFLDCELTTINRAIRNGYRIRGWSVTPVK